jgi:YVTN family beta-propeller protein
VLERLGVGGEPHHVTPSWDLRHLYVDNPGTNRLDVIDPQTAKLGRRIKVASPYNLYFTPDGTKAIVVAESLDRLDVYELPAWRLAHRISTPDRGIDHLDFSADGSYLLASTEFSGTVLRVDLVSMAVTGRLRLGGSTVDVKLAPDGRRFFVANQMRDGVSVVDPLAMDEVAFIRTGRGAHGMVFSADTRRLFVSNRLAGDIAVIDVATLRLITRWHIGGSPDMLILSTLGNRLWVSNRFGGSVSVVDARSGRRLATIATGSSPHGLTYYPQPGAFCIGHNGVTR